MTNGELGHRIGVSHSMASRIRRGRRLPGIHTVQRIHEEFGIPLVDLVGAHRDGPERFGELLRDGIEDLAA